MEERTVKSLLRDALIDDFEPALQAYVEMRLTAAYGAEWVDKLKAKSGQRLEGFRKLRREPFAERERKELDLLALRYYAGLIGNPEYRDAFYDWPWDQEGTKTLFNNIAPVRDSASHAGPQTQELNAEMGLLSAEKILRVFDPDCAMHVRHTLLRIRGELQTETPTEPLHNVDLLDEPQLIGRQEELVRLAEMVSRPRMRVVSITGRGGIGKTALARRFVIDAIRYREPPFDLIVYVSAKKRELAPDLTATPITADVETALDICNALLKTLGVEVESDISKAEQAVYEIVTDPRMKTLLVLDNLEAIETDDVLAFIERFPGHTGSRLVFTSRDNLSRGALDDLALQAPSPSAAIELARRRAVELRLEARFKRREDVLEFVEAVHRVPLAILSLAARLDALTVRQLADRVRSYSDLQLQQYSWDTSLERLTEPQLRVLLAYALVRGPLTQEDSCAIANVTEEEFREAIRILRRFHFVGALRTVGNVEGFTAEPDAAGYVLRLVPKEHSALYSDVRARYLEVERVGAGQVRADTMRDTRLQYARAAIRRRDFPSATRMLAEVLKLAPNHPDAHGLLGVVDLEAGRLEDARHNFRQFEERQGTTAEIYQRWGYLEYRSGHYDVAADKLRKALELRPGDHVYRHYLGVALWQLGLNHLRALQVERARQSFVEAEEQFQGGYFDDLTKPFNYSHNEKNHCARISNLINLRDLKKALEVLALAQKEYPDSPELRLLEQNLEAATTRRKRVE